MVGELIGNLVEYGVRRNLIGEEDRIYCRNQLSDLLKVEELTEVTVAENIDLEETLAGLLSYAVEKNLIDDSITEKDLFDTRIMGILTPRPSCVVKKFHEMYQESPEKATNYFYQLCQDSDYIRRYRIAKDRKWKTETEYGELDITINLSKPEKDPKAIAAAGKAKSSSYPKCMLCVENEGYAGRVNHPARQNLRIIPVTLKGEQWGFQYSPYVYYNEHSIVLNGKHVPMKIQKETFEKLLEFVKLFPHYFVGSNADLPIVGGSILSHDHFQGGHYEFPMARAEVETTYCVKCFDDVSVGTVCWPMSVIRLRGKDAERVADLGGHILDKWRSYSDEKAFIFAETNGEPHNTITPIVRRRGEDFEMDLVLRNNITTEEHPLGVFHPHAKLHHIKKENIGLIEVMGLAVLPGRLKKEIELLKVALVAGTAISENESIAKHAEWAEELKSKYTFTAENVEEILQKEIGIVFKEVLEDAGVFKRDALGKEAFGRFMESLNEGK